MTSKLKLNELDLKGKRVLMRVDMNVPLDKEGHITDDTRIKEALPSIKAILDNGASLVLISHLGRPKGKEPSLSLKPVAERLEKLLGKPVEFLNDCVGKKVEETVVKLTPGEVALCENLRFHPEEEKPEKNPEFAKNLAKLGNIYVDDAFGCAHRAHSSIVIITNYFPQGTKAMGLLLEKEIKFLGELLKNPERPFYALVGGAKISSKIGVLNSLIDQVDGLFLGGAMVYTFMKAKGIEIGLSLVEDNQLERALEIIRNCEKKGIALHFPIDIVAADAIDKTAQIETVSFDEGIKAPFQGVDIGPKTIESYSKELSKAKTILWNGPVGVFEVPPFDKGTMALAKSLAESQAKVIVGGGDSVSAIQKAKLQDKFAHLSTGGGAALEFLEFRTLPGIDVLDDQIGCPINT